MLTSRHQTVNERRASAVFRRAFLKFCRASRQNKKRGVCHPFLPNVNRDSFIEHFDSAREFFSVAQARSAQHLSSCGPRLFPRGFPGNRRSATTKLSYAREARASPATHPICQTLHIHSSRRVDSPEAPESAPVG